jgi:hypothetical protein
MTLPRIKEISKFQQNNPPLHMLVNALAQYCGIEFNPKSKANNGIDEHGNSLFDMLPPHQG